MSSYSLADVEVQLRDVAFSGSEGSGIDDICVDAGPADRSFVVTLSTSPDTALAGQLSSVVVLMLMAYQR